MKFFLISLVVLVVLFVLGRAMSSSMTLGEKFEAGVTNKLPKRIIVVSWLLVLSFIETVVSLIIWIVNM